MWLQRSFTIDNESSTLCVFYTIGLVNADFPCLQPEDLFTV